MNRLGYGFLMIVVASLAWLGTSWAAEEPLTLELATANIKMSTFYDGTTLDVSGSLPADADAVIQVSGPKKDVHLKQKGKVAGFLWMNKYDVSLENTPAVYMVYTPAGKKEKFLNRELGVGYKALVNGISIEPESADKEFIFGEYVKLMEKAGVYAVNEDTIKYGAVNNGVKTFTATLTIPSLMSAGDYTVEALAIENGAEISRDKKNMVLELAGLPASIANMAYDKPLLFGIMAVVIAIGTGLIIGVLFKGGGGAH